jgi:hypothetical protein
MARKNFKTTGLEALRLGNLAFSSVTSATAETLGLEATAIGCENENGILGGSNKGSTLMMTLHTSMEDPSESPKVMTTSGRPVTSSNIFTVSYDRYEAWDQAVMGIMFEANIVAQTNIDAKNNTPIGVKT